MSEPSPSSLCEPPEPQAGDSAPAGLSHHCPLVLLCFSMPAPGDREVTGQGLTPRVCWALWGAERPLPPHKTFPCCPKSPKWQQKPRIGARRRCPPAASSCTVTPRAVPALSPLPGRARGGQGGDRGWLQALPGAGGTQNRARRMRRRRRKAVAAPSHPLPDGETQAAPPGRGSPPPPGPPPASPCRCYRWSTRDTQWATHGLQGREPGTPRAQPQPGAGPDRSPRRGRSGRIQPQDGPGTPLGWILRGQPVQGFTALMVKGFFLTPRLNPSFF